MTQLAISIRQPWAWAILKLGKRIENRSTPDPWRRAVGQKIWLHASSWRGDKRGLDMREEFAAMVRCANDPRARVDVGVWPGVDGLSYGGIVGECRLVAVRPVIECAGNPWACGPWCLVLDEVREVPFTPCKGALGLFEPEKVPQ